MVWPTAREGRESYAAFAGNGRGFPDGLRLVRPQPLHARDLSVHRQGRKSKVIVGVDGWIKAVQRHPEYDGHSFTPHLDNDGKVAAITCTIHRKDRAKPIRNDGLHALVQARHGPLEAVAGADAPPQSVHSNRALRLRAIGNCGRGRSRSRRHNHPHDRSTAPTVRIVEACSVS